MIENVKKTTKLAISAIFVALITVGAFIKIPIPGVPFTLQILFTTMAGLMLGGAWGGATVATYTLMGLIGLPVFTTGGGIAYVLQPTFGYLIGFIIGAAVCGAIVNASKKKSIWVYIGASLVNMVIVYVLGVIYFYLIMTFYMGEGVSVKEMLVMFFSINIAPDAFKCVLASILSLKLGKVVNKICMKSVVTENDMNEVVNTLREKVLLGEDLTRDELISLERVDLELLCRSANEIRERSMGNTFHTCTIINAKSGKCSEDCKFCSQSSQNNCSTKEYELLDRSAIVASAANASNQGINNFSMVTSGKRISKDEVTAICNIIRGIKETQNISLCGSFGLLDKESLIALKESGMDRYHNNLESSKSHFESICTTHTYDEKKATITDSLESGLKVCTGGIIGMGESYKDRVDMALEIAMLGVDSVPLNMFTAIEGTKLNNLESISYDEFIRAVAIFRFAMPYKYIRLAGGRSLMEDRGERAFMSGANATITGELLTTVGIDTESDREMLVRLGFDFAAENLSVTEKEKYRDTSKFLLA